MIVIEIGPGRSENYVVFIDGLRLPRAERAPFVAAAKFLVAQGHPADTPVMGRHRGAGVASFVTTLAQLAKQSVRGKGGREPYASAERITEIPA